MSLTPVPKLELLWTWDCRYLLWEFLRTYTESFKYIDIIILTQGYFNFLVTWLAQQIKYVRTIIESVICGRSELCYTNSYFLTALQDPKLCNVLIIAYIINPLSITASSKARYYRGWICQLPTQTPQLKQFICSKPPPCYFKILPEVLFSAQGVWLIYYMYWTLSCWK